jgi:hypothetical protein
MIERYTITVRQAASLKELEKIINSNEEDFDFADLKKMKHASSSLGEI